MFKCLPSKVETGFCSRRRCLGQARPEPHTCPRVRCCVTLELMLQLAITEAWFLPDLHAWHGQLT